MAKRNYIKQFPIVGQNVPRDSEVRNVLLLICFSYALFSVLAEIYSNSFIIETPKDALYTLRDELERRFSLRFKGHIHSNFYLFVKQDIPKESEIPWESEEFRQLVEKKFLFYEQEIYKNVGVPNHKTARKKKKTKKRTHGKRIDSYEMGIDKAWSNSHSGQGVVVAVVDSGVQVNHSDLRDNVDRSLSCDFLLQTKDGGPKEWKSYPELFSQFDHGTNCAGLIAAIHNDICTTGVAPKATIASLLILNPAERMLESRSARALTYESNAIQIYSNSWGTVDSECGFDDISKITKSALQTGVKDGRNGKGSLFIFPSGNGEKDDNCNADAYANSIFTLTIASVSTFGQIPDYAEPCPCVLASTLGSSSRFNSSYLLTTSLGDECTDGFNGTSASTAMASGIIALVLEANPNLSKRDIEHIIVETSKYENLDPAAGWKINGANRFVSDYFGFGLMDADAMIKAAETWKSVPNSSVCTAKATLLENETRSKKGFVRTLIFTDGCSRTSSEVEAIEYVQLELSFHTLNMDKVSIELSSPMGTASTLLSRRVGKCDPVERAIHWNFSSIQFWGENPKGNWTLRISNVHSNVADNSYSIGRKPSELRANLILHGFSSKRSYKGTTTDYSTNIEQKSGKNIEQKSEKSSILEFGLAVLGITCVFIFFRCAYISFKARKKKKN